MKIGIDAKWYLNGNPSGKVVVRNIIDKILALPADNEIYLFIQKKDKPHASELIKKIGSKQNIRIVYIPNCINFLSNMVIMPFYTKRMKLDVCLYQNFTPVLFNDKTKNIVYIHDFLFLDYPEYYSYIERQIFRLMKTTAKYADSIITISESEKRRINKYVHQNKGITTIHHGISDDFKPTTSLEQKSIKEKFKLPAKFILYLGRINVRKNIQVLLNAMPYLKEDLPLVIVGKKDHKTFDIDKTINDLGLDNKVLLLGHLAYQDVLDIIGTAHIFVFPSFAEGFGLPPLEAMKSGVPVISSNATCLPEVCGEAALYFSPDNKGELIEQINKLITSTDKWLEYRKRGLNHVKDFTWDNSVKKILQILTANSEIRSI